MFEDSIFMYHTWSEVHTYVHVLLPFGSLAIVYRETFEVVIEMHNI
jgi:hypothetical protein